MEIQSLKLLVTDADLAALLTKHAASAESIQDLQARITPEGVILSGKYPTPFFAVSFETTWQMSVLGPEVWMRLENIRVLGLPAGVLKGALIKTVRDNVAEQPGVRVEDDAVVIHAGQAVQAQGIQLNVHFTEVRLSIGAAVLIAGASE